MKVYSVNFANGRPKTVFNPPGVTCDAPPLREKKREWPLYVLADTKASANAAVCETCDAAGRLTCGARYCKDLGESKPMMLSAIIAGECPRRKFPAQPEISQ